MKSRKVWFKGISAMLLAAPLALGPAWTSAQAATVRCVKTGGVVCGASYMTISAAVSAAASGDIILVGPGLYNESVAVNTSVTLLGAKAGVDARTRSVNVSPTVESIVNGASGGFNVHAQNVIIDGFTVENAASGVYSGISFDGGPNSASGSQALNNILKNNTGGIYLNITGYTAPQLVANIEIRRNLFVANNTGGAAAGAGDGIFSAGSQNVDIYDNKFMNEISAAIVITNSTSVTAEGNQSVGDATFFVLDASSGCEIAHNRAVNFAGSGIFIAGSNQNSVFSDNYLAQGPSAGIFLNTSIFGGSANQNLTLSYNQIVSMKGDGITVDQTSATASLIIGNIIQQSGADGIDVIADNAGNLLIQNSVSLSGGVDCRDATSGSGTAGTADTWFRNRGKHSSPAGLCAP